MATDRQLTCNDVKTILKNLGFTFRKQKGSHEHWIKDIEIRGKKHRRKVTLDCPKAPFSKELISSMAKQAGVTKRQFHNAL